VAEAVLDGIRTNYEVLGEGPPLLMFAPGGFDGTMEKWRTAGVYQRTKMLEHLARHFRCILFDRRECGLSGGRVEAITWQHYARQGKRLLESLGIERAHLIGGCMGCSPVLSFSIEFPESVASMVLYWPVGGAKYRIRGRGRFAEHVAFVHQAGLQGVLSHALREGKPFSADAKAGPWASVLQRDAAFAAGFVRMEKDSYLKAVEAMAAALFDRDTSPGAEPEDLMKVQIPACIVPGRDESHATSAARYLEECLPQAEYWDVPPEAQDEYSVPGHLLKFLQRLEKGS
jgi:pimeloyl-ACP methyl ester carboxylesterase